MTETESDYFINHQRATRFPWTIYHRPLEQNLLAFLRGVSAERKVAEVLVIGCGLMQELDHAPTNLEITVIDIDARAIDAVLGRKDPRIHHTQVISPDTDLRSLGRSFDAVYAKEVIEHIPNVLGYLEQIRASLKEDGRLWLSTPNYGEPWLPLLENTFLELVARVSGYTRRDLHPSKLTRKQFLKLLRQAGFKEATVTPASSHLALIARATR